MIRQTIAAPVSVEGIGIHTGTHSRVTLSPAPIGAGVVFRSQGIEIPAHVDYVVDTSRCTILGKDGITISTVEHLMATLAGNNISDIFVDIDGKELPIGDGSAEIWQEAILSIATSPFTDEPGTTISGFEPIVVTGRNGAFISARSIDSDFRATVAITFDHALVGTQVAFYSQSTTKRDNSFSENIAPARTFGFIEEVEALRKAGLALGGSEENAVVVYPDRYSKPLHFENELARHKLLDLMGDLALSGVPLPNIEIFAVKPSHQLNVEFAKRIATIARRPLVPDFSPTS